MELPHYCFNYRHLNEITKKESYPLPNMQDYLESLNGKKDGTLHYCIDYCHLKEVIKKDSYPLPNMQDCLDSLDEARCFSSMNLSSGYWQVKWTEDTKDKTSFYGAGGGL